MQNDAYPVQVANEASPMPVAQPMQMSMVGVDPAVAAAAEREKARLQLSFFIAQQRPRNEEQARTRILENCKRRDFAVKAIYKKPVGGEKIVDLSVRFVEMALREWGNVITEASVIHEDERGRRVRISALDLQSNAAFTREVFIARVVERGRVDDGRIVLGQRKNSRGATSYKLVATDDELDLATNAAVSKALRNEGGRLLPQDLKSEARSMIDKTLDNAGGVSITDYRRSIIDCFSRVGIQPVELEKLLGHALGTATTKELTELESVYHALKDGEQVWSDFVASEEVSPLAERIAAAKEKLPPAVESSPASPASPSEQTATAASPAGALAPADEKPKRTRRAAAPPPTVAERVEQAAQPNDPVGDLPVAPAGLASCYFCGETIDGAPGKFKMPDGALANQCAACQRKMSNPRKTVEELRAERDNAGR
jgi:hypothetical protein